MAELLYFAKDGSYGSAADLTILSTEHWTDEDMNAIEEASDWARWVVAQQIHAEAVRRFLLSIVSQDREAAPKAMP